MYLLGSIVLDLLPPTLVSVFGTVPLVVGPVERERETPKVHEHPMKKKKKLHSDLKIIHRRSKIIHDTLNNLNYILITYIESPCRHIQLMISLELSFLYFYQNSPEIVRGN